MNAAENIRVILIQEVKTSLLGTVFLYSTLKDLVVSLGFMFLECTHLKSSLRIL